MCKWAISSSVLAAVTAVLLVAVAAAGFTFTGAAEYDVETTLEDVSFGKGQTDPFISGIVYDFDARILVSGYEDIPGFPYETDEAGHIHRTGQITVEDGKITKIYVKK